MQQSEIENSQLMPESIVSRSCASTRLALGFAQGLVLYFLYLTFTKKMWPADSGYLFSPLLMICSLIPVILISSLGHLEKKQIAYWIVIATAVIASLTYYDIWRGSENGTGWLVGQTSGYLQLPSARLVFFLTIGFYIAHSLVLAGAADRRPIAHYSAYFEAAWKLHIQLQFSVIYASLLWIVLLMGAMLLSLVKVTFLMDLIAEPWFAIPVTFFAFSCALHITDVKPAIIRGKRALLLTLLSWILPVITLFVAGFLLSLPWAGLALLWGTRFAGPLLMGAAAMLILLINAAFQNGELSAGVTTVIRVTARIAALLLGPLVGLAAYAMALRVEQYGWTIERVGAASCLLVGGVYAVGYAWAAVQRGTWMAPIARVNVANAFLMLAVLIALSSPLADPARISVNDQVARLGSGKSHAGNFDFDYLRLNGARFGLDALEELSHWSRGDNALMVRNKAEIALKKHADQVAGAMLPKPEDLTIDIAANITAWPAGKALPDSFRKQDWATTANKWSLPSCLWRKDGRCDAYFLDVRGEGTLDILLVGANKDNSNGLMRQDEKGNWVRIGALSNGVATCELFRKKLQQNDYQLAPAQGKDLVLAGQRVAILENYVPPCAEKEP